MERGDYFEAKAALLNFQMEYAQAQLRIAKAAGTRDAVLLKLGLNPKAAGFTWDDDKLTIEPVKG